MINFDTINNDAYIKPDRFGMAAISTIFKAFGDNIRSKEYWPWSEKVGDQFMWESSNGLTNDLLDAIEYIKLSLIQIDKEIYEEQESNKSNLTSMDAIKELVKRINRVNNTINNVNRSVDDINKTTEEISNDVNTINQMGEYAQ